MRYLLAIVPFVLVATLSAQTAGTMVTLSSQTPPPPPPWDAPHLSFEVASVKVNKSGPTMMSMRTLPTSFNVSNLPLRMLITQAYRLSGYQLVGGPSWLDSERFDIVAKAPEGSRPDQTMLMLRGLLAERFMLKVHGETRDSKIYALVLVRSDGKLGQKMSKTTDDCAAILAERRAAIAARAGGPGQIVVNPFNPPGPNEKPVCTMNMRSTQGPGGVPLMTYRAGGQSMPTLVNQLRSNLNTFVVDRTGLEGLFDYELQYSMQTQLTTTQSGAPSTAGAPAAAPIDDGPTLFDAVRELGLKLESTRGPVEHLVIDSVERPTDD